MAKADTLHVPDWKWHVWEVDPKTGKRKKWLGMIGDPKGAFDWMAKRKLDRTRYKVNNVPPPHGRTQNPPYEVYATSPTDIHRGDDLQPRVIPGKTDAPTREERAAARKKPKAQARRTAVPKAPKPKDSKEMRKIKADAAALLARHKADEQAEMEAEKS